MGVSAGLELGTASVRAVVLEGTGRRLRLLSSGEVDWAASDRASVIQALRELRRRIGKTPPIVLGIPTSTAIIATVDPLIVVPKRAHLAVQFELQQHLPFDVAQSAWHFQWLNGRESSKPSARMRHEPPPGRAVIVAAMKRAILDERVGWLRQAGWSVGSVDVTALACMNAWRLAGSSTPARQSSRDPTQSHALLHVSAHLAEWIVSTANRLIIHPVILSGDDSDLEALEASWDALSGQLASAGGIPTSVWLLGEGSQRPALTDRLTQRCRVQFQLADVAQIASVGAQPPPNPERFVVACGLASQGLGVAPLRINLLSHVQANRRVLKTRRLAWVASLFSALLATVFSASGMITILIRRQQALSDLAQQERTYEVLRPQVRSLRQEQERFQDRLRQLEALVHRRSVIAQAFQRLTEALPDEVWLTDVELSHGMTLDGVLEGYSKSFQGVTVFMDRLKSSVGWAVVKLLSTTMTTDPATGQERVAFSVQLQQPLGSAASRTAEPVEPARAGASSKRQTKPGSLQKASQSEQREGIPNGSPR